MTSSVDESTSRASALNLRLVALLAVLAVVLVGAVMASDSRCPLPNLCGPLVAIDISQGRIDTALPAPRGDFAIEQTFSPYHDGLSSIELILVHYGGEQTADEPADGRLTVELWDDEGNRIAGQDLRSGDLTHNQTYLFEFPARPDSARHSYRLRLTGNERNHASVWGYSLDVVQPGALQLLPLSDGPEPDSAAQELRFVSHYQMTASEGVEFLGQTAVEYSGLFILMLAFLLMPGCLLLMVGPRHRWESAAWLGTALALGMAIWPLAWLWLSLADWRWTGPVLWGILIAGWVGVGLLVLRRSRKGWQVAGLPVWRSRISRADRWTWGLLLLLLVTSVGVRLLAVRDLAFPPWVDSSRHGLITAVMVAQGQAPGDYSPYLPVDRFPYHYGFHAISASLAMMTGLPLAGLLLVLGQFLNGLLPLTVYAAGWMITRQRAVGLLAAFFVALPFFFPGYYATWGRMTQLAAMLVLPVLLGLTWRLGRGWPHSWPLVAILAAGVFMLHFRVFLFFLPFAMLVLLVQLISYRRLRPYVFAAGLGLILIAPRAYQLWRETNPVQAIQNSVAGFNDFPTGYLTAGWEQMFLVLAGLGLVVVIVGLWRSERWAVFPMVLMAWVATLFFLLAGDRLGLPETLVVNLNSMYISLFLPLALFLSIVAVRLWQWGTRLARRYGAPSAMRLAAAIGAGLALGILALFGARNQISIINPQTVLAEQPDLTALDWLAANVPPDAVVAVNSWRWLGSTWAAGDGGAWIVPLTGLSTTTPPIDHIYNADLFASVRAFNEYASAVADWSVPTEAEWLREQGVTHIYVGERGGFFDPAALIRNPLLRLLYQSEGTFVFAVEGQ